MHEVLLADGAELPLGKKTCQRNLTESFFNRSDIMMGLAEETGAAAVAGEEKAAERMMLFLLHSSEKLLELGIGGFLVSDVKLNGLADPDVIGDGNGPGGVAADDVADQKVPLFEPVLIFADDAAQVGRPLDEQFFPIGKFVENLLELDQSRLATELVNDVPLGLRDDEVLAD